MMRRGLFVDGWVEMDNLPRGWLAMNKREGGLKFCTEDYVFCKNPKAALKHLMKKGNEEEIANFVSNHMLKGDPIPAEAISWLDTKKTMVPEGWMLAITTNSEGLRGQLILSPQGVALASMKSFREILEKMPELAAVEMEAIFEVLGKANYKAELEGNSKWRRAEALPEGWMKIPSESIYLSPLGAILKSKRALNENLGYNLHREGRRFLRR